MWLTSQVFITAQKFKALRHCLKNRSYLKHTEGLTYKIEKTVGRWWRTPLIRALRSQRQADLCEFEASLIYRASSRTGSKATEKPRLKKSKIEKTCKNKHIHLLGKNGGKLTLQSSTSKLRSLHVLSHLQQEQVASIIRDHRNTYKQLADMARVSATSHESHCIYKAHPSRQGR